MMSRILPLPWLAIVWGAFVAGIGLWFGWLAFGSVRATRPGVRLASAAAASVLAIYGGCLGIGGISGWYAPLRPLISAGLTPSIAAPNADADGFQTVTNERDFDAAITAGRADGRPVLIDFSADWCTECRLMERTVFANDAVRHRLEGLRLIRADMTRYDAASRKLMERFDVVGPPTLIFLDAAGREVNGTRIIGPTVADEFLNKIAAAERG
jgi:thiol:disulfide interchange protein DsbD